MGWWQGHRSSHFRRPSLVSKGQSGSPSPPRCHHRADSPIARKSGSQSRHWAPWDPAGAAGPALPSHSRARPGVLVAHLTSRSRPQRHEGLGSRSLSPRSTLQPTALRAATQPDAPLSALRPQPHSTGLSPPLHDFPAPGRSHTPPTVLIGSLPHRPWSSSYPIGLNRMPIK